MPRRAEVVKRDVLPDPKYNSKTGCEIYKFPNGSWQKECCSGDSIQ